MSVASDRYRNWSREELEDRLAQLEDSQVASTSASATHSSSPIRTTISRREGRRDKALRRETEASDSRPSEKRKGFNIRAYPCRKIALRFSYDGAPYNGLATQQKVTASGNAAENAEGVTITTVEDVLWKALQSTRLVGEDDKMGDVGWSRCGRTDRGVSAGGQVVALWVRSKKVDQWKERREHEAFVAKMKQEQGKIDIDEELANDEIISDEGVETTRRVEADPESEELAYVMTLNNILPPTIRIQAWSPVRPNFSSRFDCRYRHYKYFFTSGCPFITETTTKGPVTQLDIPLMRQAAQKYLGDHDFRNFCKIDPSKQIDNYRRRVDGISIDKVSTDWDLRRGDLSVTSNGHAHQNGVVKKAKEEMYVLNLRGTAFLYHQVRHMVAVLFLIGSGLEKMSIIDELLNVESGGVARDRLIMRQKGLTLNDADAEDLMTTLPNSTATTLEGKVASDDFERIEAVSPASVQADFNATERKLQNSMVYDRKPEYEMASDRPLMLWDCGFRDSDVQWRSGTYDGPLLSSSSSSDNQQVIKGDVNSSTAMTMSSLHSKWSSLAITSELYRHFLLALPLDVDSHQAGYIPSSTLFDESANPTLQKRFVKTDGSRSRWQGASSSSHTRTIVPLGDGNFKPLSEYKGLQNAKRESTPAEKNAKYLLVKGKKGPIAASNTKTAQ